MAGEVLDFLDRPASPETIDFPLIFLDPGRESNGESPTRGPIENFLKSSTFLVSTQISASWKGCAIWNHTIRSEAQSVVSV